MTYSLIVPPRQENQAFRSYGNGHVHLLQLYQSRFDPSQKQGEKQWATLFWHGTMPRLSALYQQYRHIIDAFCRTDPGHEPTYISGTEIRIWFGDGSAGYRMPANMMGDITCQIWSDGKRSRNEIRSLFRRREKDWTTARIGVLRDSLSLKANSFPDGETEFTLADGISVLPLPELADYIESTTPQALWYEPTGAAAQDGNPLVEERSQPWPLSREQLMDALKEIEKQWFVPPEAVAA